MELHNFENNLFKAMLVGVFLMGISTIIPGKNEAVASMVANQTATKHVALASNEQPIQKVFVVGKRLPKHEVLLATK